MLKLGVYLGGESIWFFSKYITFVLQIVLAFGLAFQLPIIIIVLGKMGILGSVELRKKRKHVIIGLLIFAMLLTPPDVLTQLLLATPLILLYEFCIWFLHLSGNRNYLGNVSKCIIAFSWKLTRLGMRLNACLGKAWV